MLRKGKLRYRLLLYIPYPTYATVLWVDMSRPDRIESCFTNFCAEMQIPFDNQKMPSDGIALPPHDLPVVKSALRWLRGRERHDQRWLVVMDGFDDVTDESHCLYPSGHMGSLVITS